MIGIIIIVIVGAAALWVIVDKYMSIRDMSEGYDIQPHCHNNQTIYLTTRDKVIWDTMGRKQKRFYINKQQSLLKGGDLVKITDGEGTVMGLVTREEYKKKSNDISE